jgi:uroporphyrinogen III methyltransferase / synthase
VEKGKVWLVGAGPGDPGLLTVRGVRALREADAVVYDRLVNPLLLDYTSPECERNYAGKGSGGAELSQAEINELLVHLARAGKRVVRLKGGDPFVFGRGGEEGQALHAAGVPFEVVPGVTSAIAVPAYAGIPVSHRGVATSFAVITGHEASTKAASSINWSQLAQAVDTIVCLMGAEALPSLVERLLQAGRPPDTSVALVRWGTLPRQQTVTGTLADIVERVRGIDFGPPAVAVIGGVVRLRDELTWFETRPLFGKRVLVTRTREQTGSLRTLLEDNGAEVIELPTLEIAEGASPQLMRRVIEALIDGEYAWVIFTSANGVRRFFHYIRAFNHDARTFRDSKVAVVGAGTAEALIEFGIRADAMPQEAIGEKIADELDGQELARRRVLVPRAEGARPELIERLRAQGAEVEEVPLYSSEVPRHPDGSVLAQIRAGEIDVFTFASSSAVRNLVKMLGGDITGLDRATIACIGPLTAETAKRCGLSVQVVATEPNIPGLVQALRAYLAPGNPADPQA